MDACLRRLSVMLLITFLASPPAFADDGWAASAETDKMTDAPLTKLSKAFKSDQGENTAVLTMTCDPTRERTVTISAAGWSSPRLEVHEIFVPRTMNEPPNFTGVYVDVRVGTEEVRQRLLPERHFDFLIDDLIEQEWGEAHPTTELDWLAAAGRLRFALPFDSQTVIADIDLSSPQVAAFLGACRASRPN